MKSAMKKRQELKKVVTVPLDPELYDRLQALSLRTGESVQDCVIEAVMESLANWDAFYAAPDLDFTEPKERFYIADLLK